MCPPPRRLPPAKPHMLHPLIIHQTLTCKMLQLQSLCRLHCCLFTQIFLQRTLPCMFNCTSLNCTQVRWCYISTPPTSGHTCFITPDILPQPGNTFAMQLFHYNLVDHYIAMQKQNLPNNESSKKKSLWNNRIMFIKHRPPHLRPQSVSEKKLLPFQQFLD